MKKSLLIFSFIVTTLGVNAQEYTSSLGARIGGWENGITLKHFVSHKSAVEGIFSSRWRGFNITGLYEVNHPLNDLDGLSWYIGGGAHVGFFDDRYYTGWGTSGRTYTVVGIDGILGVEYVFEDLPINVSIDWKPAVNLAGAGNSIFWGNNVALSGRYIFKW